MVVCVDGNDGTGKSTLVASLRSQFPLLLVQDRGLPTAMTEGRTGPGADLYLILDAPVQVCQRRLAAAGRSLDEPYHNAADLADYRARFLQIAERLGASVLDAALDAEIVAQTAADAILSHSQVR